ncbi:TlpA family protein disulfide reductase [Janthinobacterium aquaticum]|uniref:TlpA family protein disulfide reductase n=1 Tax=Janthinobacterium sp. FT58W TaxID=2654254 RepID=UPI001264CF99|nr:TlpA disulfide reductase family protein [Janthinobacterium sp. FT58W]KAB8043680.1 redoxin family protein [Janthinobacterium sp. FT58W]
MTRKGFIGCAIVALLFGAMGVYVGMHKKTEPAAPVTTTIAPGATGPVTELYALSLPDAAGTTQALSQWKGKNLLVNFWAPWCPPCVQEMPELSEVQGEFAAKNLQIIGVGIDSASNIATFANKVKIAYPVYVSGMSGTELSRHFGNATGGLPFTVLIGADGEVKKTYLGRLKFDQLRADLAKL